MCDDIGHSLKYFLTLYSIHSVLMLFVGYNRKSILLQQSQDFLNWEPDLTSNLLL